MWCRGEDKTWWLENRSIRRKKKGGGVNEWCVGSREILVVPLTGKAMVVREKG